MRSGWAILGTRYSVSTGLTGFLDLMTGVVIDGIEEVAGFGVWIWALVGGFLVRGILLGLDRDKRKEYLFH
jgi:hypothetical protein